jgi:hypothetical protein
VTVIDDVPAKSPAEFDADPRFNCPNYTPYIEVTCANGQNYRYAIETKNVMVNGTLQTVTQKLACCWPATDIPAKTGKVCRRIIRG